MKGNLLILHGGGPTAVLNCSLYGAVTEALDSGGVDRVYGAKGEAAACCGRSCWIFPPSPGRSWNGSKRRPLPPWARRATRWTRRIIAVWRRF